MMLTKLSWQRTVGLIVSLAAVTVIGVSAVRESARAAEPLEGAAVTSADVRVLVAAAKSCPTLTPSRLAGQVMVASGFTDRPVEAMAAVGATGVAALSSAVWNKWTPWPGASPGDRAAGITALAHHMCQMIGQIRSVKLAGDPWSLALAAHYAGMEKVVGAGAVPASARDYVDTVNRYAAWYALQPQFGGTGDRTEADPPTAPAVDTPAAVVPDSYVAPIVAAGKVCPDMPPSRIAAQIMAASGFDAQRLGPTGEQGVAQFLPQVWVSYVAPSSDATPWDPTAAVAALGATMCTLIGRATAAGETAPAAFLSALAVFTRGEEATDASVSNLAALIRRYQDVYARDTRLGAAPAPATSATPAPPPSRTAATRPPDKAPATRAPTGKSTKAPARDDQPAILTASADGSGRPYGPYFLYNSATKLCADLPGYAAGPRDGPVLQAPCARTTADNQEWSFVPRSTDDSGHQLYWIRNIDDNFCIDPPGLGPVGASTPLDETGCFDQDNQYFRLEPTFRAHGRQYYWLRDVASNLCLDVPGYGTGGVNAQLQVSFCSQHDDQDWALIEKSSW